MQSYLSREPDCKLLECCLKTFKIIGYIITEQNVIDFNFIVDRYQSDTSLKAYDVCRWLDARGIDYELSFLYDKSKSILWNIKRYKNFYRLKYRLKYENYDAK